MPPEVTDELHEPHARSNGRSQNRAVMAERERVAGINSLATRYELESNFVQRHISEGSTMADFRTAVLDVLATRQERNPTITHTDALSSSLESPSTFRSAAVTALLDRIHGRQSEGFAAGVFADGEAAFARRVLQNSKIDCAGWSDQRVLRSYVTTSDFSLIAGAVANVRVGETYTAAAAPITQVFGHRTVPDFNAHTEALVDWTTLKIEKVNEHGEYVSSYVDESGETIRVYTIGGVAGLSRQLIHNAAGALNQMSTLQGRRLAADTADRMVAFVEQDSAAGPRMRDDKAVFHASRGNIETLATYAQTVTATELMRLRGKQARRKGIGDVIIGTLPTVWLVHPDFEAYALQTVAAVQANVVVDVNPLAGKLTVISEPRLSSPDQSWLLATPSHSEGAVRVYLEDQEGPYTDTEVGFHVDGVQFKIRLDFGLGWLDWRSWTRLDHNPTAP